MCGVLGYLAKSGELKEVNFEKSLELISHRGPDDSGIDFFKSSDFFFFQGFRRLSILDLSKAGHQPMRHHNLSLTFNGEVYNFQELRDELIKNGYNFYSNTDTEVILKSIHYWGIETAVNKFNGMFAIAVFDAKENKIFIARDRLGIKPLYYYLQNDTFIYSSEIKPILNFDGIDRTIDKQNLIKFLSTGYVPADGTVFKNIKAVLPGQIIIYKNGELEKIRYWSAMEIFNKRELINAPENQIKAQLKNLIESSVKYRMISDVPLGTFLSGGIDSSLVTAVMQSLSEKPVKTFSIGFEDEKYNEAGFAKDISSHLGTNHFDMYLTLNRAKEMIPEMINKLDQPFADSSSIPMMMVSNLAKQNVTVSLSGDGGDELFCGYKLYDQALKLKKYKNISKIAKFFRASLMKSDFMYKKYKYLNILFSDSDINIINSGNLIMQFYANKILNYPPENIGPLFNTDLYNSSNIQELNMLANIESYLHDDILKKVDFATMATSLESRVPLLDHRIVEYSFSIPHDLKYKNGIKKYILKEILYDFIPKNLMDRPKKGFSVPVLEWLHNDLYFMIEDSMDKQLIDTQGVFSFEALKSLKVHFDNVPGNYFTNSLMWNFVVFQQWHKANI